MAKLLRVAGNYQINHMAEGNALSSSHSKTNEQSNTNEQSDKNEKVKASVPNDLGITLLHIVIFMISILVLGLAFFQKDRTSLDWITLLCLLSGQRQPSTLQ